MSKSANMLRTRRKDNNVKPNRRLDRKSSRGMLYENEELRLKTININAEVERGQSDIKKLKRENDQLRREIWYLRDEYDKLDKLLREKGSLSSASSSTYSSESESCSSYTEESEAVETSQNIENVNKTHLKKINEEFDNLSIVQEENSGENSDKNSTSNHGSWSENVILEKDIIKPDQSYPIYDSINHTNALSSPKHFFSPIKMNKPNDDYVNNQFLGPDLPYADADQSNSPDIYFEEPPLDQNPYSTYFQPLTMPVMDKTTTDVIVKTDNHNFNTLNSHSTFSNGGNLEELLNDIETISHDILTISNTQNQTYQNRHYVPFATLHENVSQNDNKPPATVDNYEYVGDNDENEIRPYKSELNVVLMPTPMKLIEIEKYKNIQKSCESINKRSIENLTSSSNDFREIITPNLIVPPDQFCGHFVPVPPNCPEPHVSAETFRREQRQETNPFFFGNIRHSPNTSDFVATRAPAEQENNWKAEPAKLQQKYSEVYSSKANLIETGVSSDHVSSENEENLKFKTTRNENEAPVENHTEKVPEPEPTKTKSGLKGKVSIHFKGKKDKSAKNKSAKRETRFSIFDFKLPSETKEKKLALQKTPSTESKISTTPVLEPKTPTTADSTDTKISSKTECKNCDPSTNCDKIPTSDRKSRKSSSASPERRHDGKKVHKRHKKSKNRRSSISTDRYNRERSYSICTDRSNILDRRLGFYGAYDDYTMSERERTNSLSSCETLKGRKLSVSHFPTGKIPWCGCWGNGCL